MRTVWKFAVPVSSFGGCPIPMPSGAKVVHVAPQGGMLSHVFFWVEVELKEGGIPNDIVQRTFAVFGTGHEVPEGYAYVGTAIVDPVMPLVWHLYEKL